MAGTCAEHGNMLSKAVGLAAIGAVLGAIGFISSTRASVDRVVALEGQTEILRQEMRETRKEILVEIKDLRNDLGHAKASK